MSNYWRPVLVGPQFLALSPHHPPAVEIVTKSLLATSKGLSKNPRMMAYARSFHPNRNAARVENALCICTVNANLKIENC